ncbi:MAG: GntR family transcriptional regulator [Actinomycetota bacterium]|jgi:DNA-binding GntR family transcriptional regulator|nr:GntR family transcriptional regulator [Actinomycetota bacterium]MDA8279366.1 GntR family transcriptional regulator [Actinomycetota bacterium]
MDGIPGKVVIARGRATARLQSTELLRELILGGTLAPGQRLNEVELAAQFSMSRGPIRESLQTLAAEGLVTIRSHKGTFVKTFTKDELANLYEVRLVLEAYACRQAALRRTDAEAEVLGGLLDLTRQRLATEGVFLYENDFHLQILAMTHNDVLANQGRYLLVQMALARSRSASSAERSKAALEEHQAVLEAICDKNDAHAADLMERHLGKSYENARRTLEPTLDAADPSGTSG